MVVVLPDTFGPDRLRGRYSRPSVQNVVKIAIFGVFSLTLSSDLLPSHQLPSTPYFSLLPFSSIISPFTLLPLLFFRPFFPIPFPFPLHSLSRFLPLGSVFLPPRLASVTVRQSSSGRQPNFAVLNRGRHLYLAGRPSRWALAHILVC